MKSWKKPTDRIIDRALASVKKEVDRQYFFSRLKNPLWLQPLVERGRFQSPPKVRKLPGSYVQMPVWPELRYLKNVVSQVPTEVVDVVLGLPRVDNPRVYDDILDIARQLHGEHSAKLMPKVRESLILEHRVRTYQLADLLAHWTSENLVESALELSRILVVFAPDPESKAKQERRRENPPDFGIAWETSLEPSPRIGTWEYNRLMSKGVRPLSEKEPFKVARILIDATADMIHRRTHEDDRANEIDFSDAWCERLFGADGDNVDAKKALVHTLTFACEQVYEKSPEAVYGLDAALRKQPWKIFKRLRQHLYAQNPSEQTKPWIRELILNHRDYHLWEYPYEFQQMIRRACEYFRHSLILKEELERIFHAIRSGPSKANHQAWLKLVEEKFTVDGFRRRQRKFHRLQFNPFAPVLFGKYKTYFKELENEADPPISDEDYPPHKTRSGIVSTHSPRPLEGLLKLTDEELLCYINEWEGDKPIYKGDNLIEVNVEGLSVAFQTVFKEQIISDSKRLEFWMANRNRIKRPIFVEKMIVVMRECVAESNFDNFDEWLTFIEWVLSHPDDSEHEIYDRHAGESRDNPRWSNSRWAASDFIGTCFKKDVDPPVSARGELSNLLELLCTQFSWRLDQHLTGKEPIDEGTNNPRCRALEALVNFGLWLRRSDRTIEVPEVSSILGKRFAPDREYALALPEYAILGKNFNHIFYLDKAWAIKHKPDFFPQDEFPKWLAAFDSFVAFNSPFKSTFELLHDDFKFALEHLPDFKQQTRADYKLIDLTGQHLFTYYLLELYPLRGKASLLEQFYQATKSDSEQWSNLFDYVGHLLWDTDGQLERNVKEKIIDFFEWRFEVREPLELQQFTYWLKAECLDVKWRLDAYFEILNISKAEDMAITMEVEALYALLPNHTEKVIECFAKLTKDIGDNNISIFVEEATSILQAGFRSSDENVRQNAVQARLNLLKEGRYDLLDLGD